MKYIMWCISRVLLLLVGIPRIDPERREQYQQEQKRLQELANAPKPEKIRRPPVSKSSGMIDYQRNTMFTQGWPIRRNAMLGGKQDPYDFGPLHLSLYMMLRDDVPQQIIMQKLKMTSGGFSREFLFADWFIHSFDDRMMLENIKNTQNRLFREEQKTRRNQILGREMMGNPELKGPQGVLQ